MGRAPCCEKMGLKKGPWTTEEDHVLISYIQRFGHGNWRALPKKAGLLRCGKSCRLRWTNYLRPDIKRGNFSKEEEETIIKLHQALGNRWSAIAAKLPGRTDNEIKNVWHTYLKKRTVMNSNEMIIKETTKRKRRAKFCSNNKERTSVLSSSSSSSSPSRSSSVITEDSINVKDDQDDDQWINVNDSSSFDHHHDQQQVIPEIDESFWSEIMVNYNDDQLSFMSLSSDHQNEGMDFWLRVFMEAEELQELPGII